EDRDQGAAGRRPNQAPNRYAGVPSGPAPQIGGARLSAARLGHPRHGAVLRLPAPRVSVLLDEDRRHCRATQCRRPLGPCLPALMQNPSAHCDVAIIGAGPVALFAVFECGMLDMRCAVFDALPEPGGQCAALYPEKPIYDIPGYPRIDAAELVERLAGARAPFAPGVSLVPAGTPPA